MCERLILVTGYLLVAAFVVIMVAILSTASISAVDGGYGAQQAQLLLFRLLRATGAISWL
jgi:hypothetical protein